MHYFMVQKIISIYRASIDIFFITVLKRKLKSNNVKETAQKHRNKETNQNVRILLSKRVRAVGQSSIRYNQVSAKRERNTASIPYENVMPGKLNIFSILTCNSLQT